MLAGALAGPYALGLVSSKDLLSVMIEIGAVMLMFTVGIEFNLDKIRKFGWRVLAVGLVKMGGMFLLGYYASGLLGLPIMGRFALGSILTITSTVIFIKVLEQKGMLSRPETPFLVALLVLEDIVGIFLITFFSSFSYLSEVSTYGILSSLGFSFIVLFIAYLVSQKVIAPALSWLTKNQAEETNIFSALSVLGLMVFIAMQLKLSPTIGAFLAGNLIAKMANSKEFERAVHPFLTVFAAIFFFCIGASVSIPSIASYIPLLALLLLVLIIGSALLMFVGTFLFAETGLKGAIFSGVSMATIGEFSLLMAKEASKTNVGFDILTVTSAVIFASALLMPLLLRLEGPLASIFSGRMKKPLIALENARLYIGKISSIVREHPFHKRALSRDFGDIKKHAGRAALFFALLVVIFSVDEDLLIDVLQNRELVTVFALLVSAVLALNLAAFVSDIRHLIADICISCGIRITKEFLALPTVLTSFTLLGTVAFSMLSIPFIESISQKSSPYLNIFQIFLFIAGFFLTLRIVRGLSGKRPKTG